MVYREFTFKVPKELYQFLISSLFSSGCIGTYVLKEGKEVEFKAYFKEDFDLPQELKLFLVKEGTLKEKNWNEAWKKYYKPVKVSEKVWVVPSWLKGSFSEPSGSCVIYIYPGRGFGTGTHETTRLSMRLIEEFLEKGDSLLDVGTGSGILSILAKKLGASRVVACDIQEGVEEEVKRNAHLSGVGQIEFVKGSARDVKGEFDLVVANIEKHLLEPILPDLAEKSKGKLIVSGILKEQKEEFVKKVKELGFRLAKEVEEGNWKGFLFTR